MKSGTEPPQFDHPKWVEFSLELLILMLQMRSKIRGFLARGECLLHTYSNVRDTVTVFINQPTIFSFYIILLNRHQHLNFHLSSYLRTYQMTYGEL